MEDLEIRPSRDLDPQEWDRVTRLCEDVFEESFDGYWKDIGPAMHFLLSIGSVLVSHACVVERWLNVGNNLLRTGYVEAVATARHLQGRGYGSAVIRAVNEFVSRNYDLGALSTASHAFYERLGWQRWVGPSFIRTGRGLLRTADADDSIMILRTQSTPPLDLSAKISAEWRPGELW